MGGLFIRLKYAKITEGEPARDGQTILHYAEDGKTHRRSCGLMKRVSGEDRAFTGMVCAGIGCALIHRRVFEAGLSFKYDTQLYTAKVGVHD